MDNGYLIPPETLSRLGNGDIKAGRRVLRLILDLECSHVPINGPTERPASVREATEADEDGILALLRADFAENARHVADPDEQRIKAFVYSATRDKDARIGVIDGPSGIVGMIYLVPEMWWFSTDCYVAERLTYVAKEHRTARHVSDLLRFARWVVDEMSRTLGRRTYLLGSVVATRDARAKTAVFSRLMNFAGGVYCYPDPAGPNRSI